MSEDVGDVSRQIPIVKGLGHEESVLSGERKEIVHLFAPGHDDHWHLFRPLGFVEMGIDCVSIDVGHYDVQQDKVGKLHPGILRLQAQHPQGLGSVVGNADAMALTLQGYLKEFDNIQIVVDN